MNIDWAVNEYMELLERQGESLDHYYEGTDAAGDQRWGWWHDLEEFHGEEFAKAVADAIQLNHS